ncbi:hypothetical protein CDV31_016677 [Fusarium ambrosium]|uniref:Uncharacterized protein n=1 Tax=Fusarium ambrosium TaxID=131363 RepID=A0A428S489_9HYPO|nr:hypothetical protein CDV31_016677 [Fusarium ambrosium]
MGDTPIMALHETDQGVVPEPMMVHVERTGTGKFNERLLIFVTCHQNHSDEPHVALGYIGTTLRDLNGLSRLKIRLSDLVETEMEQIAPLAGALPPTIETLHLYWDSSAHEYSNYKRFCDKIRRAVFTLLMAVDQVPNLRWVSIDRHGAEGEDEKLEWEKCVEGWRGKATQGSFNFERQPDTMNQ